MKILFVHDYPPMEGGGVELNVFKTAAQLTKTGFETVIATSRMSSETYKSNGVIKEKEGVRIEQVSSVEHLEELIKWADIVHIYFTFSCRPASMLSLKICAETNKPCIFSLRTEFAHIPFSALGTLTKLEKDQKLTELISYLNFPNIIVSGPSYSLKETLEKLGIKKPLNVINNGTDFKLVRKPKVSLYIPQVDVTYIGEISFLKGVNYLIDSIRYLKRSYPNIKARIIGGGSDAVAMKHLVEFYGLEENIKFTGYVDNKDIPEFLNSTKLYVHPSLTESWCNSVLEALSHEVPVICTNVGGLLELTQNGKFAQLVEPGESNNLTGHISKLLSDEREYKSLKEKSIKARIYVTRNYTLKKQVKEMIKLYKKVKAASEYKDSKDGFVYSSPSVLGSKV